MFGAIRPSSQRVMGVAVRAVVAMVGFGVHSVQAGETIVKPDQAYACTSLIGQPDSLNYVERLFANDGTYIFAWSRSESIKNEVEQRRNQHGEWLSFGRWKVIPTANGGSTLEVSEDIRYHYSDRSWHLPSESARPAFVVETVSIGATASRLVTDMQPKRRGEAVPASTDGSGFTSTVKGQDYFTCIKRPGSTADKQELWRNVTPKAVEAKNALEQRKVNREEANRQQNQNAGQIRQQAIQDRAEAVQAVTTARQLWQRNGKPGSRCNWGGIPTSNDPGEVQVAIKDIQEGDRYMGMNIRGIESTASNLYRDAKINANRTIEACK